MNIRPVAVLCAGPGSAYHSIPGIIVYDQKRDARTFPGDMPVITHAPCRAWSVHTSHQAKPLPGEKELGLFCADMLRKCGGILEHPAHSRLFFAARLPLPNQRWGNLWTIEVCQVWWNYPMLKKTWLCLCGISPKDVHVPLKLHPRGSDLRTEQLMSHHQRSRTTPEFAQWLVDLARKTKL